MLYLSYVLFYPSTPSSMLTLLRLVSSCEGARHKLVDWGFAVILEEGDGRCVRASWPYSIKHSVLNLLLNPPLVFRFHKNFRGV